MAARLPKTPSPERPKPLTMQKMAGITMRVSKTDND